MRVDDGTKVGTVRRCDGCRLTEVAWWRNYFAMATTSSAETPDIEQLFELLADRTRRRVVEELGSGPRRAGALAQALGTSPSNMSRHLRALLEAGVITDERPADDARARVFHLRPGAMVAVQAWLDQIQAQWDEQLASFQRHVERRAR
jgi:DNA-binding transcriptional ArsR family regulator